MATRVKDRQTPAKSPFGLGTLSLTAFVGAAGAILAETCFCVWSHLSGAPPDERAAADSACVVWMIRLTPVFLLGIWMGFLGVKQQTKNSDSARIGVWANGLALIPANLIPLLSYCFHWVKF